MSNIQKIYVAGHRGKVVSAIVRTSQSDSGNRYFYAEIPANCLRSQGAVSTQQP